ncbi:MAG: glycosyl hydrolase family protein, partial [Bacteroidetes bacterium]
MSKVLSFPDHFKWGTSTAAAQIETASDHNWRGVVARDGSVFNRTTDHELRRYEDLEHIVRFGTIYRAGVDWARLQASPKADFQEEVVAEYRDFFAALRRRGMEIMFVIHHFTHPRWFEEAGGWPDESTIPYYVDFAERCVHHFGDLVSYWNTFNEPNVFALNAYLLGNFPPMQKGRYFRANRVLRNMGHAHDIARELIKARFPQAPVGISMNTAWFEGQSWWGRRLANFMDRWFHWRTARHFEQVDFWGISYYAYIPFRPLAVTEIDNPGELDRLGIPHDQMWGYRPEGLGRIIRRVYQRYQKPVIITENGICTDDPQRRIAAIKDYLKVCHELLTDGIPLQAYIFWSTFDNMEWNLGNTYRFGLVTIDWETMERHNTAAADFYAQVCAYRSYFNGICGTD